MSIKTDATRFKAWRFNPMLDFEFETFSELYAKNWDELVEFLAVQYTGGDWHEAEDEAQDIFEFIWVNRFHEQEVLKSHELFPFTREAFLTILWSKMSNYVAGSQRKRVILTGDLPLAEEEGIDFEGLTKDFSVFTSNPELPVRFLELKKRLVNHFKDPDTLSIFLHLLDGYNHRQIIEETGWTRTSYFRKFGENREEFEKLFRQSFSLSDL